MKIFKKLYKNNKIIQFKKRKKKEEEEEAPPIYIIF
jgi:hypothetical protein